MAYAIDDTDQCEKTGRPKPIPKHMWSQTANIVMYSVRASNACKATDQELNLPAYVGWHGITSVPMANAN